MESPLRRSAPAGLTLIETFGWRPDRGFARLPAHLMRMARGSAALGVPFERGAIDRALAGIGGAVPLRARLTLDLDGRAAATATPLGPPAPHWTLILAEERLLPGDPWLGHKTSLRPAYDAARAGLPPGVDEAVLLNTRGEVCDGTITTLFADLGAGLVTPPLACGLLPGVLRAEMLARGLCREAVLSAADLMHARLMVGNSLRGLMPARLAPEA